MKKTFFVLVLTFAAAGLHAQTPKAVSNHSVTLNLVGVDYAYEQHLGGPFTIIGRAGLGSGMEWTNSDFYYTINPVLSAEPRWYYNFNRRVGMGRSTEGNAGSFLSLEYRYLFPSVASNGAERAYPVYLTPTWGMRRVYGGHWLLEFNTGVSFMRDTQGETDWAPRLNLRFGYKF